jgi:predicted KAP-like P-loop ATPase
MILPDYPILKTEQDQLRRAPLARKIAETINSFDEKNSFVIGIEGAWGAGKTSFINLILNDIDTSKASYFVFNPWNFSDEASLLRDFFTQLSQAVESVLGKTHGKKIKRYASKIADIDLGVSAYGVSINPLKWASYFAEDLTLEGLRKDLDKELSKVNRKLVIVIDDIDRLDQKETKLIFKLVKLTANFKNTIFVLSYDREQVEKRITDKDAGIIGGDYLRKIVQVAFTLPMPDEEDIRSILFSELDKSINYFYPNKPILDGKHEENRWSELLYHGFGDLFKSVRDIKRYISSLRLDWSIVGTADVNKIDFLGIEAIRVFAPLFYNAILTNEDIFIKSYKTRSYLGDDNKAHQARQERYLELLNEFTSTKERDAIEEICGHLFPQVGKGGSYGEDTQEKELMISHPNRFKFYFQLGVPNGEVSEGRVQEIVESANHTDSFKSEILQAKREKNIRRILRRLLVLRESLGNNKIKNILITLWNLEEEIRERREAMFDYDDVDTQIMRFGYHAILTISETERNKFVLDLYNESSRIYHPLHLLAVMVDAKKSNEIKLTNTTIEQLKKILEEKIVKAAKNGSLKKEEHAMEILYRWKDWGSADAVSKFIGKWIATRQGLLEFLQTCVGRVLSTSGNYNTINLKSISGLYPLDKVTELVNGISDEEITKMNDGQKEAISLFKNPPGDFYSGDR